MPSTAASLQLNGEKKNEGDSMIQSKPRPQPKLAGDIMWSFVT